MRQGGQRSSSKNPYGEETWAWLGEGHAGCGDNTRGVQEDSLLYGKGQRGKGEGKRMGKTHIPLGQVLRQGKW